MAIIVHVVPRAIPEDLLSMLERAIELRKGNHHAKARKVLLRAVARLEKELPNSSTLADAYRELCWTYVFARRVPKSKRDAYRSQATSWYQKAIAVWQTGGDTLHLAGEMCNLSSLYYRYGDVESALALSTRALEIERSRKQLDNESVGAWNKTAAYLTALGRLSEAEEILREGFQRFGEDSREASYLWATLSKVHSARAEQCIERARELAPSGGCVIC